MLYPGFIGASNVPQSPVHDGQQTVNWYVERLETNPQRLALYPTPGVATLATAPIAGGRGHVVADAREFAVIGPTLYEIAADGTLTSRGTVTVDSWPATLSYNGDGGGQLFVTSGDNGYILDLDSLVFTQVRTGGTSMGAHVDGYFLALDAATSTLFLSDLLDGLIWDPTQFAQRSAQSDPWVSLKVVDRLVWLIGTQTSEIWYNAGSFPFPFALHPSGLLAQGTVAPFSPEVTAGAIYWLARSAEGQGAVMRAAGFSPEVVSTFALQTAVAAYGTLADAVGDTYDDLGHSFYVLSFPTANATWVFDATASLQLPNALRWTQRGTWIPEAQAYDAWRPRFHAHAHGEHRMLDALSGHVYRLSAELSTDADGRPLRRLRRPPGLWVEDARLFVSRFALDLEVGLGLVSGQGEVPQVALRVSRDGGKTWGPERWRSAGRLGHYEQRVEWTRCGSARHWVPELVVTDPIPWRILGARVDVAGGGAREAA